MLYEVLGPLLARAADVLATRVAPHIADPFVRAELDTVALLLREVGAMWPEMFEALEQERSIFAAAVARPGDHADDPLQHLKTLSQRIGDELVALNQNDGPDPERLALLRDAVRRTADVQYRLLQRAADDSDLSAGRV